MDKVHVVGALTILIGGFLLGAHIMPPFPPSKPFKMMYAILGLIIAIGGLFLNLSS